MLVEGDRGAASVGGAGNHAGEKQDFTSEHIFTSGGRVPLMESGWAQNLNRLR